MTDSNATAPEPPATTGPPAMPPVPPAPSWGPPPTGISHNGGRSGTLIVGAILVVVGLWFFADRTLGLDLPRLRADQLWPILLIGIGVWVVLRSFGRRR